MSLEEKYRERLGQWSAAVALGYGYEPLFGAVWELADLLGYDANRVSSDMRSSLSATERAEADA